MTTASGHEPDDLPPDVPPDPAQTLDLIERQRRHVSRSLGIDEQLIYGAWGLAWLISYGLGYLSYGDAPPIPLPGWALAVITVALVGGAIGFTIVNAIRSGRGVRGMSETTWTMYGYAWGIVFISISLIIGGAHRLGISDAVATLLPSVLVCLAVGTIYLVAGAFLRDRTGFLLGGWIVLVGGASVFAGIPGAFAILSLAGGGGMLTAAGWYTLRRSRR